MVKKSMMNRDPCISIQPLIPEATKVSFSFSNHLPGYADHKGVSYKWISLLKLWWSRSHVMV
jgi:hypothetical protein